MIDNNLYIWFNAITCNHSFSLSILYRWDIFAVELERFTRIKDFPEEKWSKILPSIQREMFWNISDSTPNKDFVISFRNYLDDNINKIIKKQNINFDTIENIFVMNFPFDISVKWYEQKTKRYKHNYHHLFHACSAYYPSGFKESVILCMDHDWYDEEINSWTNVMHTIWYAKWNKIELLYKDDYDIKNKKVWIWSVYNLHSKICWIWEWTFMWLSWFWSNKLSHINIFDYSKEWVYLDEKYFITDRDSILKTDDENDDVEEIIISNFKKSYWIDSKMKKLDIQKSIFADISDKVQVEIEEGVLFLARKAYQLTKCENICIAWWVGFNILANSRILNETDFKNIFVQPASNDAWISLWWLYYLYHNILWNTNRIKFCTAWLWFEYSNKEILETLNKYDDKIIYKKLWQEKYKVVAEKLNNWKIIWWFQWRSEFWPRALWFRSILAAPFSIEIKNKVNNIKKRELYRPLAPVILQEYIWEYLETDIASPYMTLVANVKKDKKSKVPWIVHIDGTSRYQTVNKSQNQYLYNLLKEFKKCSWEAVLINTSFNQHDEPIVEIPEDALKMFLATDLDFLLIWDYLILKEKKYSQFVFDEINAIDDFNKDLKIAWQNNLRGDMLLKLLWIKKLWFDYDYNIWDRWVKLNYSNDLKITIEIKKETIIYSKEISNIWIILDKNKDKYTNIIKIIDFFVEKNQVIIYDLLKWI